MRTRIIAAAAAMNGGRGLWFLRRIERAGAANNWGRIAMSETSTTWHTIEARPSVVPTRLRSGFLIAIGLLCAMTAAEVLFLRFVAGPPDSVNMLPAAEGIAPPP